MQPVPHLDAQRPSRTNTLSTLNDKINPGVAYGNAGE
jgi:hypothetical protein